jgi:ABC-type Na+ efflux pump permease subunit
MNMFEIILTILGVWQILISFIMHTKNVRSCLVFKIIPFFSGCYCVFYAMLISGIIKISL